MRSVVRGLFAALVATAAPLGAEPPPPPSEWRPALYLLGTSERGSGDAYAPPNDKLDRDDAVSLALGLDARQRFSGGRVETSLFALVHDPLSSDDRGYSLAARTRGTFARSGSSWVIRLEDAPRIQRQDAVRLSDFLRNEARVEIEHGGSGARVGLRVSDRRRWVPDKSIEGFNRQWISASVGGGGAGGGSWRLEAGPQHYSTEVAKGWRLASALEAVGAFRWVQLALRFVWVEPPWDSADRALAGATPVTMPTPMPTPAPTTPTPTPTPEPPFGVSPPPPTETTRPGAPGTPDAYLQLAPPPPSLVGPSLVVAPLLSDEGDWDFGVRKQELVALASGRIGGSIVATVEVNYRRERGPDLRAELNPVLRRDRFAARLSLRGELGSHAAVLVQGGWDRLLDDRPRSSYSWGIASLGVELRP